MYHILKALVATALLVAPIHSQAVDPVWVSPSFTFTGPSTNQTTRCSSIPITITPGSPAPHPPYTLVVLLANSQPLKVDAGSSGSFTWPVSLDLGGPYLLTMYDSAGAPGTTGTAFNVVAGTGANTTTTCTRTTTTSSTLGFNVPGTITQCNTVALSISGGTPPYSVSFVAENNTPKKATFATGTINWTVDVHSGTNAYFTVSDTAGNGAVSQFFTVGSSSIGSCIGTAKTVTPGSPALSTVYSATGSSATPAAGSAAGSASSSKSSANPGAQISSSLLAIVGVVGAVVAALPL
ncbi:hypothetical protein FRB93_004475 [Tulasnella sp. JGI-2019a]|nr:hypothetical protein FRB93_004475 [Tulasnella sp. JGI-2019a]